MRSRRIPQVALAIALAWFLAASARARPPRKAPGEKYALLVGVRHYDPNELRNLPYPEADVTDLAAVLKAQGYRPGNIVLMTQAVGAVDDRFLPRAPNIRAELRLLLKDLDEADTVLVALAGHGVQFRGESESYFCPAGAHLADKSTLLPLGEVYRELEASGAGLKLLLVDACRNDPQSENSRARSVVSLESVTRPQVAPPPGGVVAFFSCSEGEKAYEHAELKHGVFFHYIIEALRGDAVGADDQEVDVPDLEKYVKRHVRDFVREKYGVRQMPELRGTTRDLVPLVTLDRLRMPKVGELLRLGAEDASGIHGVAYSPDGRHALSGHQDKTVRLWDLEAGREVRRFRGHTDTVLCVAFDRSGRLALSSGEDKTIRLWNLATGQELHRFVGHSHPVLTARVRSATFSPNGRQILSGSDDLTMRLWDAGTGREVRRFPGHVAEVMSVAFLSDGRRALTSSLDTSMQLWDLDHARELSRIITPDGVRNAVLSPDERRILSCGYKSKILRLWDLATGQELGRFEGHDEPPLHAVFSPDGRRVLSGGSDKTVRLWDVETRQELHRFEGHTYFVTSVAFSPDGRRAISGSWGDSTLRLWALPK